MQYWPSTNSAELVAGLVREEGMDFVYFPVRYAGAGAAESVDRAFSEIDARGTDAFDLIVVIGEANNDADIGVVHQVLAPRIARASAPVLTSLGPDDGETILGDTACKVFPTVDALVHFLVDNVQARYALADQALARIKSLGQFLIAEYEVESTIFLQSVLQPTLQHHLQRLTNQANDTRARLRRIAHELERHLVNEKAALDQLRDRIGFELARIAKNNAANTYCAADRIAHIMPASTDTMQHLKSKIDKLRTVLLLAYLCVVGAVSWWTTPGNAIFFSGTALVVLSVLYVAICNRLMDGANHRYEASYPEALSQDTSGQTNKSPTDDSMFDIPTIDSLDGGRLQKSNRIEPWIK